MKGVKIKNKKIIKVLPQGEFEGFTPIEFEIVKHQGEFTLQPIGLSPNAYFTIGELKIMLAFLQQKNKRVGKKCL